MRTRVWLASEEGGGGPTQTDLLAVCEVLC